MKCVIIIATVLEYISGFAMEEQDATRQTTECEQFVYKTTMWKYDVKL